MLNQLANTIIYDLPELKSAFPWPDGEEAIVVATVMLRLGLGLGGGGWVL